MAIPENKLQVQEEREFSAGILSVTTTYRLLITGDPSLREISRLIRILTVQKEILQEDEGDEVSPPRFGIIEDEERGWILFDNESDDPGEIFNTKAEAEAALREKVA